MALPHLQFIKGAWGCGSYSLGLERSTVWLHGVPYLTRYILYIAGCTVRLHKFHRGDDERAPHDHPWPFWTFPLCAGYWEKLPTDTGWELNWVPGYRFSYRPATYQHIVLDPPKPFWTIVVTGRKSNNWGFWPEIPIHEALLPGMILWADKTVFRKFVPWREFNGAENGGKRE